MNPLVENLLKQICDLPPDQLQELRAQMDEIARKKTPPITEDEFLDKMAAKGFLIPPRDRRKDKDRYANRRLAPYTGRMPSQILIEERR